MPGSTFDFRRALAGVTLTTTLAAAPATAGAHDPIGPRDVPAPARPIVQADLDLTRHAADGYRRWADERRQLRVQVGLSAGFTAAFLLAGVLAWTVPSCNPPPGAPDGYCGMPLARIMVGGALMSAAAVSVVPTIVFGARLGRHERRGPVATLQPAPGGLTLRF
ncbi:MAG: hypothetical protein JNL82_38515 [Myxococcales bacterium]|nr:hypothetical protein [Myxococcales bacterium]